MKKEEVINSFLRSAGLCYGVTPVRSIEEIQSVKDGLTRGGQYWAQIKAVFNSHQDLFSEQFPSFHVLRAVRALTDLNEFAAQNWSEEDAARFTRWTEAICGLLEQERTGSI